MKNTISFLFILLFVLPNIIVISADNWGDPDTGFWYYSLGPSTFPIGIVKEDWEDIARKWPNSILFDLTIFSDSLIKGKDFEISEYYIESEDVTKIKFYIWKINDKTNLSKVTMKVFNPENKIYCNITLIENELKDKNETIIIKALNNTSFSFNKTGLWRFQLDFDTNNVNTLIWRHIGNHIFQTFKPIFYYNSILDPLIFFNRYEEEIPVIILSDALQLSNINTMKEQSEYLYESAQAQNKSAKGQSDLANATNSLAIVTLIMAFGVILSAIFTLSVANATKRTIIESRRELKRDRILKVITEVIDDFILEANKLKVSIEEINQNKIPKLMSRINLMHLRHPSWLDFGREFPNKLDKIKEYLEDRDDYFDLRRNFLNEIEDISRNIFKTNSGIRISVGKLNAKRRLSRLGVNDVFENHIVEGLGESILQEKEVGNSHSVYIFNRYKSIWLSIKQNPSIKEKISWIKALANKMEKYSTLEELNEIRNDLMEKYVITPGQIEISKWSVPT